MRSLSRSHIADIWRRGQKGETLAGEDLTYYAAMREHTEYHDIWERAAELGDNEINVNGTNPFLHISMHSVVENQIASRNPPETDQTVFRLMKAGLDRHESLHRIAGVLTELMWEMMHAGKTFDLATYRRRLRALKP